MCYNKKGDFMKKYLILCLLCLILIGCHHELSDNNMNKYSEIKNTLTKCKDFDKDFPFQVSVVYNEIQGQWRYDLIIDQPVVSMYNITAISYSQYQTDEISPNIGIFDEIKYHLVPDYVNKENGYYKGIQLSGIVSQKSNVYVYISYYTDQNYQNKIEKYIEVKDETR